MQDSSLETGLLVCLHDRPPYHEVGPDQGYYIRICTEKTETEATLPISQEALELCGEWGTGKVFKGLTRSMTHHPLKQWIAEAGIRKHITFHCLRHNKNYIYLNMK